MKILAVNSSDHMLSVALSADGEVCARQKQADREHNLYVLEMIDQVMSEAGIKLCQIDALAFGDGPGSFTGLRISAGIVQGIALGIDVPVIPVSCMAAIAHRQPESKIVVAIEAIRNQIHWSCFVTCDSDFKALSGDERLTEIDALALQGEGWVGAGSGFDLHASTLRAVCTGQIDYWRKDQLPMATEIAQLGEKYYLQGQFKSAYEAIPKYRFPYLKT